MLLLAMKVNSVSAVPVKWMLDISGTLHTVLPVKETVSRIVNLWFVKLTMERLEPIAP